MKTVGAIGTVAIVAEAAPPLLPEQRLPTPPAVGAAPTRPTLLGRLVESERVGEGAGEGRYGSDGVRTAEGEGWWGTRIRTRTHLSAILNTRASRALQGKGCRRHLQTYANRRGRRSRRLEADMPFLTSGLGSTQLLREKRRSRTTW